MSKNLLLTSIVSTLLLTSTLTAGSSHCSGGFCKINVPTRLASVQHIAMVSPQKTLPTTIEAEIITFIPDFIEVVEPDLMEEEPEIIVLPSEKYVAHVGDVLDSIEEEEISNINSEILAEVVESIENKILEKTMLPFPKLFCDNNQKAIYHEESDSYECA